MHQQWSSRAIFDGEENFAGALMIVKRAPDLTDSEVTPKVSYVRRRAFLLSATAGTAGILAGWRKLPGLAERAGKGPTPVQINGVVKGPFSTTEPVTPESGVTTYNNFYEFGVLKDDPSKNAKNFVTSPWAVSVEGEVAKPRTFSMDEIMKLAPLEERIYRHRCVETWSIVVPWIGYSLNTILKLVEPTEKARFVAFHSYYDPAKMPLGSQAGIQLPYLEGLRLDEAMHPLTLLCVGMYGETLPNQDGAPVRIVVPWKYGFKSVKSIVKIQLVKNEPPTAWSLAAPNEYGFYANVNPTVDHPRWSQKTEHRLTSGLFTRPIPTRMFNGYAEQVAGLYSGMDLRRYF
jgi:sulfoxide reductase catalytic subunit YedY